MIICGDALTELKKLPSDSINCCVTSPPYYGLRSYLPDGHIDKVLEIGLEETPEIYINRLVDIFHEVRRVLKNDGTLWVNIGNCYANTGGIQQPHRDQSGGMGNYLGTRGTQGYAATGGGFIRPNAVGNGIKPKDLIGIPWMLAFALRADGWYLRQEIIWYKPNAMPESVKDRPTCAHETIFLLSKNKVYYYDAIAIKEPAVNGDPNQPRGSLGTMQLNGGRRKQAGHGRRHEGFNDRYFQGQACEFRNKRNVWTVTTKPFKGTHFAVFPPDLIQPCILAGCPEGGTVLDPFSGSGTTGLVAKQLNRQWILIDINFDYTQLSQRRICM